MFPASSKKKMGGVSLAFPDVCKTPAPPAPFVPVPYPNIAAASSNLKGVSVKIRKFEAQFKKSSGDEAGTMKGIVKSLNKISALFMVHSATVKVTGKQASKLMVPMKSLQLFKRAQKQQKAFEQKVKRECDLLLQTCKGKQEQFVIAKQLVAMAGKAARGHRV